MNRLQHAAALFAVALARHDDSGKQKRTLTFPQMILGAPRHLRPLLNKRYHAANRYKEGEVFQMSDGRHYRVHKDGSFRRVRPAQPQPEKSS